MSALSTSPRAPLHRHWPAVALLTLLLILTISHIYIQLAFPLHAVGLATGLALLAAGMLVIPAPREKTGSEGAVNVVECCDTPLLYRVAVAVQVAWVLWNGVALLRAPVPAFGRPEFSTIFLGFLAFFVVAESVRRWRDLPMPRHRKAEHLAPHEAVSPAQILSLWWALAAVLLSLYAIYQIAGPEGWPKTFDTIQRSILSAYDGEEPDDFTLSGILHALREKRAFATFGAPNIFAAFLVTALPILLAFVFSTRKRLAQVAGAVGFLVVIAALVCSQSRGGFLAAALALAWFLFNWRHFSRAMRTAAAAAAVLSVVLVSPGPLGAQLRTGDPAAETTQTLAAQDTLLENSAQHRSLIEHLASTSTVRQRVYYWQSALALWARTPLTGGGAGSYEVYYPQLRRAGGGETIYAHSWFFQFGSETGLVGIALFLGAIVTALVSGRFAQRSESRRATPSARPQAALLLAFEAAAIGLLAHGLVEYSLSQRELYLDSQVILGLLAGTWACLAQGRQAAAATMSRESTSARDWIPWIRIAATAGAIAVGGFFLLQIVLPSLYSRFFAMAARDVAADANSLDTVITLYRKSLRWEPDQPANLAALGLAELHAGTYRGMDRLRRAAQINPHSATIQKMLAMGYDLTGAPGAALDALRHAVELHPLDPSHRLDLAERLVKDGKMDEARHQLVEVSQMSLRPEEAGRLEIIHHWLETGSIENNTNSHK